MISKELFLKRHKRWVWTFAIVSFFNFAPLVYGLVVVRAGDYMGPTWPAWFYVNWALAGVLGFVGFVSKLYGWVYYKGYMVHAPADDPLLKETPGLLVRIRDFCLGRDQGSTEKTAPSDTPPVG
ncbi:MAG: hypothetical protein PHC53_05940 [Patescibacteria group bacterium]|nr:hypothetical protein [Patescibacteria group bacterium]